MKRNKGWTPGWGWVPGEAGMRQEGTMGEEDEDDGKNREYGFNDWTHLVNRSLGACGTLGGVGGTPANAVREAGVGKT